MGLQIIRIKVFPGAKKERVIEDGAKLTIYVREQAVNNLANRRVCGILAERFDAETRDVHIVTGHRSQNKLVEIDGV